MEKFRPFLLVAVLVVIGASIWALQAPRVRPPKASTGEAVPPSTQESPLPVSADAATSERIAAKQKKFERYHEIVEPKGFNDFINAKNFTIGDQIGKKVVLVDFWTYSCINCQRTTPYLNAWYQKYKDKGLEIVGVHTPEFEFEKKIENVNAAVRKFGIEYPVVLDNDYATWTAYRNRYWPREYLIDIDGFVVHDHIGEGGYDETETAIQDALRERMQRLGEAGSLGEGMAKPIGALTPAAESPETYFGSARNSLLANGTVGRAGDQTLTIPETPKSDTLYLGGTWNFTDEYAQNKGAGGRVVFRYKAGHMYMVASADRPTTATVLLDGKPLDTRHGSDVMTVAGKSEITISEDRLYEIVNDPEGLGEHTVEIRFSAPGVRMYTFTFG